MLLRLRPTTTVPHFATGPRRHLLVGYKNSPAGRAALARGEEIARCGHARLIVVVVLHGHCPADAAHPLLVLPAGKILEHDAIDAMRAAVDALANDISVTSVIGRGPVGRTLAQIPAN